MTVLPEPKPTAPQAGQATPTAADRAQAARLLAALDELGTQTPTSVRVDDPNIPSWKDGPRAGDTPPAPQPDSRIVPAWALGIAVGSIGVGAGSIGLGCAAWLVCEGLSSVVHSLSSVTLLGVLTVAAPFAGGAMLITAIAGAISKAKKAAMPEIHNHTHAGPEYHQHRTTNTKAIYSKTINKER